MKPSFHARLLNGPFDDPALYVRILREGRALMFDLGFTANLSPRDILKTTDIFVSHTHIDHFIGFDNILRINLKKDSPLRFYGPEGFLDCIEGKLKSYAWNLIRDYPLVIEATEVWGTLLKKAAFKAEHSFIREELEPEPFNDVLMKDSFYSVSTAILDHQIPCLAFSLKEDNHINIDKSKLNVMGLPVGPWLRELKMAIRNNRSDTVFAIDGRMYTFSELRGLATITRGQKLSYVVDAIGSEKNREEIIKLARGSDVLYIEAYFSEEDKERAIDRFHLTAREAGSIARQADVGRFEAIHFSPRYMNNPEKLVQEAEEEFQGGH